MSELTFSQMHAGGGTEALRWQCEHLSVHSGVHTFTSEVPTETIESSRDSLLAYWQTIATCDCEPPTVEPSR